MVLNKMAKNHLGERFVIRSADSSGMPIRGGVGCSCNCLIIGPTNCQISVMEVLFNLQTGLLTNLKHVKWKYLP